MAKRRRMPEREKRNRAAAKKDLQAQGVLAPDKPRLNRKKFSKETQAAFSEEMTMGDLLYVCRALHALTPPDQQKGPVTPEQIGALKVMRLAVELKRFDDTKRGQGETGYSVMELYEKVIMPVIEL